MTGQGNGRRPAKWRIIHADRKADEAVAFAPVPESTVKLVEAGKAGKLNRNFLAFTLTKR